MNDRFSQTLLDASEKTAFVYRIDGGMDERDRDEIESMDSGYVLGRNWPSVISESVDLRHRMGYMRNRNLGFGFLNVADDEFESRLRDIDENLPITLAYMVSDAYRDGTQRLSDLLENVTRKNPAKLRNILETGIYEKMIGKFILSLGIEYRRDILDDLFFERIPADKFGCASIEGNQRDGYRTQLILKILLKRRFKA